MPDRELDPPAARIHIVDQDAALGRPAHAIHIVGAGGAGMSAIATVLARMGHGVSGSDQRDSALLERLGPTSASP